MSILNKLRFWKKTSAEAVVKPVEPAPIETNTIIETPSEPEVTNKDILNELQSLKGTVAKENTLMKFAEFTKLSFDNTNANIDKYHTSLKEIIDKIESTMTTATPEEKKKLQRQQVYCRTELNAINKDKIVNAVEDMLLHRKETTFNRVFEKVEPFISSKTTFNKLVKKLIEEGRIAKVMEGQYSRLIPANMEIGEVRRRLYLENYDTKSE